MFLRGGALVALAAVCAMGQNNCPSSLNFLTAATVNLKPSPTSHIDVVRQSDGSYTGFASPQATPPNPNPIGAGSQLQVSTSIGSGSQFCCISIFSIPGIICFH